MKKRLVSIIINCYNGEKYLFETLKSIQNQKYKNFEVIFIDNCSTDNTYKIFKNVKDRRFKYFKTKKKIKLYNARNFALKEAANEWVVILDHDDIALQNRLEIHANQITKHPNVKLFFGDTIHFKDDGSKIRNNFDIFNLKK